MILTPSNYCFFSGPKPSERPILIPSWDPPQASEDGPVVRSRAWGRDLLEDLAWVERPRPFPTPGAQSPQQSAGGRVAEMVSQSQVPGFTLGSGVSHADNSVPWDGGALSIRVVIARVWVL